MANILFVSLGSGFDPNFERNMSFVKEYSQQHDNVRIVSVDIEPVKRLPEEKENELVQLKRVQYEFQEKNIASYTKFINEHIPNLSDFDRVIICDSIHFLNHSFGNKLQGSFKIQKPEMDITVFSYTSFKMSNPYFESQDLMSENKSFDFNKFMQEYKSRIIDLFKDKAQGRAIFLQIEKQCMSDRVPEAKRFGALINSFTNAFRNKQLFKDSVLAFDENGQQNSVVPYEQFKNYLNDFISNNITIDLIAPEQENKPAQSRRSKL